MWLSGLLTELPRSLAYLKFPRLSPILFLHNPDYLPTSVFGRASASPDSLSSDVAYLPNSSYYRTYRKSKSPLSDDGSFFSRSVTPRNSGVKTGQSLGKGLRDVPLSPRIVALRKSYSRNHSKSPKPDSLYYAVPRSGDEKPPLLSKNVKRPEIYHPKKRASEKRAALKKSRESLEFQSAESYCAPNKPDHPEFHPDFDTDDFV